MDLTFEIEIVRLHSEGRTPDLTLCCEIERFELYWQPSNSHIERVPGKVLVKHGSCLFTCIFAVKMWMSFLGIYIGHRYPWSDYLSRQGCKKWLAWLAC